MSIYKRLLDDSVKLQKANVTIQKLKNILNQKTEELKMLRKNSRRKPTTDVSG